MWAMSHLTGTHQEKGIKGEKAFFLPTNPEPLLGAYKHLAGHSHSSFPGVFSVKPLPNPIHSTTALTTILSQ